MVQNIEHKEHHPVALHEIYGVNCYQGAIGYKPVTTHFNQSTGHLGYITLCPGNLAEFLHAEKMNSPTHQISSYDMKKLIIAACKDDQLVELEGRSTRDPINVPDGKRLIALFYSDERKDFDFHYYDQKSKRWKNKTPIDVATEVDYLPPMFGGYTLTRLFIATENMQPKGVPHGELYKYRDHDVVLSLPSHIKPWERGPSFQRVPGGFYLPRTEKIYAAPDLSFDQI